MPQREKTHRIPPSALRRSRALRRRMTRSEAMLWQAVRDCQLGFKIRRQHPIGPYVVDFFCIEAKLVIEIDGDVHAHPQRADLDEERTLWLERRGLRIIRFEASQVETNLRSVSEQIRSACRDRAWE